jgi:hypothetical protein
MSEEKIQNEGADMIELETLINMAGILPGKAGAAAFAAVEQAFLPQEVECEEG